MKYTTMTGKGAWRLTLNGDGEIIAVELWKEDEKSVLTPHSYEVLDINARGGLKYIS